MSNREQKRVSSPCVSICGLNEQDICEGCYRSGEEIRLWSVMSEEDKRATVLKAYEREKKVNPFL